MDAASGGSDDTAAFVDYLRGQSHAAELRALLLASGGGGGGGLHRDNGGHYAVNVNALELLDSNATLAERLFAAPQGLLPAFDVAIGEVLLAEATRLGRAMPGIALHARISNLPICPELTRSTLPRTSDVGRFLSISGTVGTEISSGLYSVHFDFIRSQLREAGWPGTGYQQREPTHLRKA